MHRLLLVICLTAGCRSVFGLDDPKLSDASSTTGGEVVISGTVTGLAGSGLILQNIGSDDQRISSSGDFAFPTHLGRDSEYNVTVFSQPTNPSDTCTVSRGTGVAKADVFDVLVACAPASFTLGGVVVGIPGGGIMVTNNSAETKQINANGAFTFATPVRSGQPFDVQVLSGTCYVFAGNGTMGSGPVTTVLILCSTSNMYFIGGLAPTGGVTGLNGSVKLKNNNDTITVNGNGSFAFPTPANGGGTATYDVTIAQQPSFPPAAQNCVVNNGTGTVGTTNVANVSVSCTTRMFSVGGTVSGLRGTVELQYDGGTKTITADGPFAFDTPLASGLTYAVSVRTQPQGQLCAVGSHAGTVQNSNVTSVVVLCADR